MRTLTRRSVTAAALALVLSVTAACSSSGSHAAGHAADGGARVTTTTAGSARTGRTYGVGRKDIVLVDASRDTPADKATKTPAKQGRRLPTVILYPTENPKDDASTTGHPVAAGAFPLVVFSHGVTASGPAYVGVMKALVAHGYVVALPTFPLTSGPGGWSNLLGVQQQPGDVSFIITELLARSASGKGLLGGHLDPNAVAAAGHSLGAITSLFYEHTCCRDRRIEAVVAVSGTAFPGPSKSDEFSDSPSDPPLLMLHGKKDKTLRYEGGSRHIFDLITKVPRALVTFPQKGHVDILDSPSFMPSVVAFLDMELRHDPTGWRALSALLAKNGDATIEVGGGLASPH